MIYQVGRAVPVGAEVRITPCEAAMLTTILLFLSLVIGIAVDTNHFLTVVSALLTAGSSLLVGSAGCGLWWDGGNNQQNQHKQATRKGWVCLERGIVQGRLSANL